MDGDAFRKGCFVHPTVLGEMNSKGDIAQNEIFAPVLSVVHGNAIQEVIEIVNNRRFGNRACLFTGLGAATREFRNKVDASNIGINLDFAAPMALFPFSGWGGSFFGYLHR